MKVQKSNTIEMSRFSGLSGIRDISHFITTRRGGVSTGAFASMNPGAYSGDDPGSVGVNREILSREIGLPAGHVFAPFQTHEDRIRALDTHFLGMLPEERTAYLQGVDALVTDLPEVCVAVSTADCVPLLLYAPDRNVVAAVHAGWRGTVLMIAAKTVRLMADWYGCDPGAMIAGIGPSIGQEAFEVGEEVVDAFRSAGFDLERVCVRHPETGKGHIDLWEANRVLLIEAGLCASRIEIAGICTYTHFEDYFSARRLGVKSGRILSGIYLRKSYV